MIQSTSVHSQFNYELADLNEAARLMQRILFSRQKTKIGRVGWFLLIVLAIILVGITIARSHHTAPHPISSRQPSIAWTKLLPGIIVMSLIFGWNFIVAWRKHKNWPDEPANLPQTLDVSDEGITLSNSVQTLSTPWHAVSRLDQGYRIILLRVAETSTFIVIPKRAFDASGLEYFKQLATDRIHARTGAFPVLIGTAD